MIPSTWTIREKVILGVCSCLLIFFGLFYLFDSQKQEEKQSLTTYNPVQENKDPKKEQESQIVVDVKGAVKQPGIYRLAADSRVYQALKAAGGLLPQADQKQINLAQKCQDEMVLYVPIIGESPAVIGPNSQPMTNTNSGKVNINTASTEELEKLDAIGPAKAEAIVKYRETHGPFESIDALTQVPGIGEKTLDKFRDQLTLH